jgi:hypothetical protein
MARWLLLVALPILISSLLFEAALVSSERFLVTFFSVGQSYGAPFVVGVGSTPVVGLETTATLPERFSVLSFVVDVLVTAAIALGIAAFLRIRSAWMPSAAATAAVLLNVRSDPPVHVGSYGFTYWIYWLVAFALMAAIWTGFELYRARPRRG